MGFEVGYRIQSLIGEPARTTTSNLPCLIETWSMICVKPTSQDYKDLLYLGRSLNSKVSLAASYHTEQGIGIINSVGFEGSLEVELGMFRTLTSIGSKRY